MILNKAKTVKWLWHTSFLWSFSAPSLQPDRIRHHHRIKIGSSSCKGAVRAIKAQATPALSFPHNSWCGRSNNSTECFKKQQFLVYFHSIIGSLVGRRVARIFISLPSVLRTSVAPKVHPVVQRVLTTAFCIFSLRCSLLCYGAFFLWSRWFQPQCQKEIGKNVIQFKNFTAFTLLS